MRKSEPVYAIDRRYRVIREIGQGAYGLVVAASDRETGASVAIKKITRVFDKLILAKRSLREIKLMRHFSGHDNTVRLIDIEVTDPTNFNEIYIIEELMEADLHQIIRSGQALSYAHLQYFLYQILRGLKFIHTANVLHRDLKPATICDFGLARGYDDNPEENAGFMTEYVATRWYRAPEIMLNFHSYTKAIDIWSVGCIFAEMLGGKPLFKGRDYVDQLNQILGILGTPDEQTLCCVGSERAQVYIRSLRPMPKISFAQMYPNAAPDALDLLESLLQFDPNKRPTVEEALKHPFLATYHDENDEHACPRMFDFSFESVNDLGSIQKMIAQEVDSFKQELHQRALAQEMGIDEASMAEAQAFAQEHAAQMAQGNGGVTGVVDQQLERGLQGSVMNPTNTFNGWGV
ncbi:mitogen-activated protein kinase spm1 [Syncephalis fuscata]|nr:mitogen-activated protein kinase spm1 [Syncephalis fuscata]